MKNRNFLTTVLLLSLALCFSLGTYTPAQTPQPASQRITIYEFPNFEGRSRTVGFGNHPLSAPQDLDDLVSSIKVPEGLVVIVYEHSGQDGGSGLWVDFEEDQPDLSKYKLDNKISHVKIFPKNARDKVWVRNSIQGGEFKAGYYHVYGRMGPVPPANPNPLVGPEIKGPPPPRPAVCTIIGKVRNDWPTYQTQITLYRNGVRTSFSAKVVRGTYTILNVPDGTYEARYRRLSSWHYAIGKTYGPRIFCTG